MVNSSVRGESFAAQDAALRHAQGHRGHHADRQPAAGHRGPARRALQHAGRADRLAAKKNPGKLTYGTPGAGSTTHSGGRAAQARGGLRHAACALHRAVLARAHRAHGRAHRPRWSTLLSVLPFVKAGRGEADRHPGDKPVPGFSYPTVAQTLPGFHVNALLGFIALHGTPPAVIEKIQSTRDACCSTPRCASASRNKGMEVVASTPAQCRRLRVQSEMKRWARVDRRRGHSARVSPLPSATPFPCP